MLRGDTGHLGSSQDHLDEQNRKTVAGKEKEHFPGVTCESIGDVPKPPLWGIGKPCLFPV